MLTEQANVHSSGSLRSRVFSRRDLLDRGARLGLLLTTGISPLLGAADRKAHAQDGDGISSVEDMVDIPVRKQHILDIISISREFINEQYLGELRSIDVEDIDPSMLASAWRVHSRYNKRYNKSVIQADHLPDQAEDFGHFSLNLQYEIGEAEDISEIGRLSKVQMVGGLRFDRLPSVSEFAQTFESSHPGDPYILTHLPHIVDAAKDYFIIPEYVALSVVHQQKPEDWNGKVEGTGFSHVSGIGTSPDGREIDLKVMRNGWFMLTLTEPFYIPEQDTT